MSKTSSISAEQRVLDAFREAQDGWRQALETHRMAPPDGGFSARLSALADAAREEARVCREADAAGFEWPPHRAAESKPPHELQPGTGRRGPEELWLRFDQAVSRLNVAATGRDMLQVASAYDDLAEVAARLALLIEAEDRASGLLPSRARPRARRSA